ncbi:MAG: hypothetical protein NPIRA04_24780 [Nitrospirales bacterium]|nr:MAG: hypothetical protein NPIRA04_24780 [Nitrospirales bacterium]
MDNTNAEYPLTANAICKVGLKIMPPPTAVALAMIAPLTNIKAAPIPVPSENQLIGFSTRNPK